MFAILGAGYLMLDTGYGGSSRHHACGVAGYKMLEFAQHPAFVESTTLREWSTLVKRAVLFVEQRTISIVFINNLSEGYQPGHSPAVLQNTYRTLFNLRQLTTNPALSTINS